MEDSSGAQHRQERALRAVQMVASSGFVRYNDSLNRSCLGICNWCRECLPIKWLRINFMVPPTLLAVLSPDILLSKTEGASRVLLPRRVLKVKWTFNDPATPNLVQGEEEGEEDEEDEDEEVEDGNEDENEREEEEEEEEEEGENTTREEKEKEEDDANDERVEHGLLTACDIDMNKVRWPEGVKEVYLSNFNRPVDGVTWPVCFEVLSFHIPSIKSLEHFHGTTGTFNRPLDGVTFPAGLREILLGHAFNQRIDGVAWPKGLERLSIPGFNHSIQDVQWPPGLKTLEFMRPYHCPHQQPRNGVFFERQDGIFAQPLGSSLPMSLKTLWLSNRFDESLRGVTWPSELDLLGLGTAISTESVDGVEWPPSLRTLVVTYMCEGIQDLPPGCGVERVWRRDGPHTDEDDSSRDSSDIFD